jgi:hypothetical protein
MPAPLRLVRVDPIHDPRWDAFVRGNPRATVYHLAAWAEILSSAYRFEVRSVALEDDRRRLRAVLPLLYKHGPMSGKRFRSLPAVPYAGPLGENAELEREIVLAACGLVGPGEQLVIATLSDEVGDLDGVARRPGVPRWVVSLDENTDLGRLQKGSRNPAPGVRQSVTAGIQVREADSERDLRRFYRIYLRNQRRLRAIPRRYRQLVHDRSLLRPEGIFKVLIAEYRSEPVAGMMIHVFGSTVEGLYAASDERFLQTRPNHALYLRLLEWALERGFREVDLGGAYPGSSLAFFKAQWGAVEVPLHYYIYPEAAAPQDPNLAPDSAPGGLSLPNRVWDRIPLPVLGGAGVIAYSYL